MLAFISGNVLYSNTTNVKVKRDIQSGISAHIKDSNTTNVKVKPNAIVLYAAEKQIQIQPMLRLNHF